MTGHDEPHPLTDQKTEARPASTPSDEAGLAERTIADVRERLASLDHRPVSEHVAVFDDIHRELSDVLDRLDRERSVAQQEHHEQQPHQGSEGQR
ncbi:hypothetical protein GCM10022402_04560 [Salinactinospora qingdaonensis]|uniref:Uncharacterized protein n=1 Tax=Salinactinospora qingdaonensis TaxID=702744 RepID=A0ABP7EX56_9ACTN